MKLRLQSLSFQTITPPYASPSPALTPLRVSFLGPQFATRLAISLSLSLPQLACDLSTLASTVSPFPYPSQTLREKVTSSSLARTCRPSLHVASLSCTLRLPKSHCVAPLSCLWSCQTTKNIFIFLKLLIELVDRSVYPWV